MTEKKIFALDIGTRKVMGLIAVSGPQGVRVLEWESKEHPTRAMSAGQIQDIPKVTLVVKQVVAALEKRSGESLRQAAVAVAGRNLRTVLGRAKVACPQDGPLTAAHVETAVLDALEDALLRLSMDGEREPSRYYCVGYVVSRFLLDGEASPQPVGHRGEALEADVLATFLPWQVLESQLAALEAAGLEAASVTLEPIAALQAVVDCDLQRFDLALVDVGAGTSDIAVVSGGIVSAFGMVPCAGDFITERLASHFLMDFQTAERVKRQASLVEGPIEASSILQQPLNLSSADVFTAIAPAVSELAERVARRVLDLGGGKPPQMALCVGGGSQTPGLFFELAKALGLPPHRVGTRAPGLSLGLTDARGRALGPETATPLGIAVVAASAGGVRFQNVLLNGRKYFLLEMGRPLTVLSALMAAGVSAKRIFGWPGMAKTFTLNGDFRSLKPPKPEPARILVNGKPSKLEDRVRDGDEVEFEPSEPRDAQASVGEALGLRAIEVNVNGRARELWPSALRGGREVPLSAPLEDRMALELRAPTVAEALTSEECRHGHVHLNGHRVSLDSPLRDGDRIETLEHNVAVLPTIVSRVMEEVSIEPVRPQPLSAQRLLRVCINGNWVSIEGAEKSILVDVLRHAPLPAGGVPGKRLRMLLDGQEAGFTTPLHHGAEVRVFFE